eukprot:TRINITY_DN15309_c0_g1_i19.p1 TRINITY_DN15309_c0_g1~~TRINITY_DN15309_c0_g1_i19.p1  ORF type:complete len:136 (+),score=7.16 TRINITY_DN15309_c0_g1_i19:48-410(+)
MRCIIGFKKLQETQDFAESNMECLGKEVYQGLFDDHLICTLMYPLSNILPKHDRSGHMHVEAPDKAMLRDFYTVVNMVENFDWHSFTFLAQYDGTLFWKLKTVEWDTFAGLFNSNNTPTS